MRVALLDQGTDKMMKSTQVDTIKDHAFLTELFNEIETKFDVNALVHYDVHLWPLVRLQLGRSFKYSDVLTDAGKLGNVKEADQPQAGPIIGMPRNKHERSQLIREHAKLARTKFDASQARFQTDLETMKRHSGPDFAVLTKIEKYYLKKQDGYFAPILDPISSDLSERSSVVRLALEPCDIDFVHTPLKIDADAYLACHSWTKEEANPAVRASLNEIIDYAAIRWPDWKITSNQVLSRIDRLRERRDFFFEIFRALKPRTIVVSSFTGWMHALWAAKDLGIPVIDVQHGGQGPIHFPSTHYARFPETGYHLLPDVFWLWGKQNLNHALAWNPGAARSRHLPSVGGHRGVASWIASKSNGELPDADKTFLSRKRDKKCVLITLSYAIDPLMPLMLFDLIEARLDLHWMIRLHPIHRPEKAEQQIRDRLANIDGVSFEIDQVTLVQLQTALFVADYHITPFSTSVREALAFGVPSAICHEAGFPLFREEIELGLLGFSETAGGLSELIETGLKTGKSGTGVNEDAVSVSVEDLWATVGLAEKVRRDALPLTSSAMKSDDGLYGKRLEREQQKPPKRRLKKSWLQKRLGHLFN